MLVYNSTRSSVQRYTRKTVVKTVVLYSPFLFILCQVLSFHFFFSSAIRFTYFYFIFFIFGLKCFFYVISFFIRIFPSAIRHPPYAIRHPSSAGVRFSFYIYSSPLPGSALTLYHPLGYCLFACTLQIR